MMNICPYCEIERPVLIHRKDVWRCKNCDTPIRRDYRNKQYFVALADHVRKYFIAKFTPDDYIPEDEYLHKDGLLHKNAGDNGFFLDKNNAHVVLEKYYEKNGFIKVYEFKI